MIHLYCFTLWIVFLKYFFLQTVTAELTETDHRPKGCCTRFPHIENILGILVNISQRAWNKSHRVAGSCAAVLALAAHWSVELTCYGVENYAFHPCPSVLHLSQLLLRTEAQPSTAVPFLRCSSSLTFLQLCFTSDPKERPCNVLTVASAD